MSLLASLQDGTYRPGPANDDTSEDSTPVVVFSTLADRFGFAPPFHPIAEGVTRGTSAAFARFMPDAGSTIREDAAVDTLADLYAIAGEVRKIAPWLRSRAEVLGCTPTDPVGTLAARYAFRAGRDAVDSIRAERLAEDRYANPIGAHPRIVGASSVKKATAVKGDTLQSREVAANADSLALQSDARRATEAVAEVAKWDAFIMARATGKVSTIARLAMLDRLTGERFTSAILAAGTGVSPDSARATRSAYRALSPEDVSARLAKVWGDRADRTWNTLTTEDRGWVLGPLGDRPGCNPIVSQWDTTTRTFRASDLGVSADALFRLALEGRRQWDTDGRRKNGRRSRIREARWTVGHEAGDVSPFPIVHSGPGVARHVRDTSAAERLAARAGDRTDARHEAGGWAEIRPVREVEPTPYVVKDARPEVVEPTPAKVLDYDPCEVESIRLPARRR